MKHIGLLLLFNLAAGAAQAEEVVPPGRESFFLGLINDPLPGCASGDISLEKDHAVFHFKCPGASTVELYPTSASPRARLKTDRFKVLVNGVDLPPKAWEEFTNRLRRAEKDWTWLDVEEGYGDDPHSTQNDGVVRPPPPPSGVPAMPPSVLEHLLLKLGMRRGRPGYIIGLVLSGVLLGTGLFLLRRSRKRSGEAAKASWQPSALIGLLPVIGATVLAALMLANFRPMNDDFAYVLEAKFHGWRFEPCLRFLSLTLPFKLAILSSKSGYPGYSVGVFVFELAAAYAVLMTVTGLLVRRIGGTRADAVFGAGIVGLLPGGLLQLREPISLQPLMMWALLLALVLVVDMAAREPEEDRRRALTWIAVGMAMASVFVKVPLSVLVAPLAWLWGRVAVRKPQGAYASHAFYLVFVMAVAVPLLCAHPFGRDQGEFGKSGVEAVARNLASARELVTPSALRLLGVVVMLTVTGGWVLKRNAGQTISEERPVRLWMLPVVAAVSFAPHLLNRVYFTFYYLYPPLIWLAIALTVTFSRLIARRAGWALLQGALAAVILVPLSEVKAELQDSTMNRMDGVLQSIHNATASLPMPCGVIIRARCEDKGREPRALAELQEMSQRTSGDCYTWATGWSDIETVLETQPFHVAQQCPQPLYIDYCGQHQIRVASQ